jgi:hypothetical protein
MSASDTVPKYVVIETEPAKPSHSVVRFDVPGGILDTITGSRNFTSLVLSAKYPMLPDLDWRRTAQAARDRCYEVAAFLDRLLLEDGHDLEL